MDRVKNARKIFETFGSEYKLLGANVSYEEKLHKHHTVEAVKLL